MSLNPPVKTYNKDLGIAVPNNIFSESEYPRLNTFVAPYLPLVLENERHDEYFVVLTGKVVALDSLGFLAPAGLKVQADIMYPLLVTAEAGAGTFDATTANGSLAGFTRYSATDVAQGVRNSRGQTVREGEPVVLSFFGHDAGALAQYNVAAGPTSTAIPVDGVVDRDVSVGHHVGFASYPWIRAAQDTLSRSAGQFYGAATGKAAMIPVDSTKDRHMSWAMQRNLTVLVAKETLVYPVVANRTGVLVGGQPVAIGTMASFPLGSRVTYNLDSDIVPANATTLAHFSPLMTGNDAADAVAVIGAIVEINSAIVGQVIDRDTRLTKSLLNKVKTRWESDVPGFSALDRMPGSATEGLAHHLYTSGTTLGQIQISPLMR